MTLKVNNYHHLLPKATIINLFALLAILLLPQYLIADNPASSCGITMVNSPINNCYTVTPSKGSVSIDGIITGTEWDGAPSKNLTGDFSAKIRFIRENNNLHFLISVDDNLFNPTDRIVLNFDPLHNHAISDDDVVFIIQRGNSNHSRIVGGVDQPWTPESNLAIRDASFNVGPTACTSGCVIPDFPTGWSAEVTITAADLGVSDLPAIMGFAVQVIDEDTSNETEWPSPFPASPATWANLKTRYPIEYMVVLDQSGSMLSQNKWENAKRATNFLANTMAILGDSPYFDDKIGVVAFSWNNSANIDQTTVPKPLSSIPSYPLGNYIDSPPAVIPPQPQYFTPIGAGLDMAFSNLGTGVKESERIVLLLSDGKHNRPNDRVPLVPSYLSYDPCPSATGWNQCLPGTDHLIQVNTVAFGEDWGVDVALLNNIKNRFSGNFGSTYNITTDVEDLKKVFIQSLDEHYRMNLISTTGYEFDVNAGEHKLIVILSWTNPAQAQSFYLQRKASDAAWQSWPEGQVNCTVSATENTSVGYAICVVENPQEGRWRTVQLNSSGNPITPNSNSQFVMVDLNLRARFSIDQQVHGTGQEIILKVDLNEAGIPVTNDPINHPVKVTVNIRRPGEGFGTYLSLRTPERCEPQPPQLPAIINDKIGNQRGFSSSAATTNRKNLRNQITTPSIANLSDTLSGVTRQASNIDPDPASFEKFSLLSKLCNKEGLIFIEEPGIELYDDGTYGDETPNDGVYTLRFVNTEYEGSYLFDFKASGISPSGSQFSRVKTIAEYVRVDVAPSASIIGSREYQRVDNIVTREYYVIPRDRFGGYLGPGYPDQVQFKTTAGNFIGPVNDYNNGIYSQLLSYDEKKERPVVSPVVQDKPFKPIRLQRFELVLPFAGVFIFDDTLALDNGFVIGARLGYHLNNHITFEAEGGVTFAKSAAGNSGKVFQAMANLRYNINVPGSTMWVPYVTAGGGYVFFRDFDMDDQSYALQGGLGATMNLTNSIGLRVDARYFHLDEVMGAGNTNNFQVSGGLVFRF